MTMPRPGTRGRNKTLSLSEKLQLIEEYDQRKSSVRGLAHMYGVGKTQVYETLKNREKIQRELQNGESGQRKRFFVSSNEDINTTVWKWYSDRLTKGLPVTGRMIQAEALNVAHTLGKTDFKASNGWLESFKSHHNIVCAEVCLEATDVIVEIIVHDVGWKEDIAKITEGAFEEDIFIAMETDLRYKMLPGFGDSHEKLCVLLCTNMRGALLKPLVVGKIARPKCFGKLDEASLPVLWKPSTEGGMTNLVLEEWLHCVNEMAVQENRTVILFLDVSCQTEVSLSNVRLVRCVEPLDRGLVSHFKCLYRRSLLQTCLLKVGYSSVAESCSATSVLDAINWMGRAMCNIPSDVVRKSFVKSGFTVAEQTGTNCPSTSTSVTDMDAKGQVCADILDLCGRLNLDGEEVVRFDDFVVEDGIEIVDESEDVKIIGHDDEDRLLNLRSYGEAIRVMDGLEKFAAHQNCPQLFNVLQDAKLALVQNRLGF